MIKELCNIFGLQCKVFLPDRVEHGYGLNHKSIASIKEKFVTPPDLMFITDCGSSNEKEIAEQAIIHYWEEMIDALHFLTELTIIAGYDEKIFNKSVLPDVEENDQWKIVYYLGLMCNCLKNKPWKQTYSTIERLLF